MFCLGWYSFLFTKQITSLNQKYLLSLVLCIAGNKCNKKKDLFYFLELKDISQLLRDCVKKINEWSSLLIQIFIK